MAGRTSKTRAAILQRRHAFFQYRVGGIHDARIDVAEDLEIEQCRGVVGVLEGESGGLVDGRRPRAGGGVGLGTRMHA